MITPSPPPHAHYGTHEVSRATDLDEYHSRAVDPSRDHIPLPRHRLPSHFGHIEDDVGIFGSQSPDTQSCAAPPPFVSAGRACENARPLPVLQPSYNHHQSSPIAAGREITESEHHIPLPQPHIPAEPPDPGERGRAPISISSLVNFFSSPHLATSMTPPPDPSHADDMGRHVYPHSDLPTDEVTSHSYENSQIQYAHHHVSHPSVPCHASEEVRLPAYGARSHYGSRGHFGEEGRNSWPPAPYEVTDAPPGHPSHYSRDDEPAHPSQLTYPTSAPPLTTSPQLQSSSKARRRRPDTPSDNLKPSQSPSLVSPSLSPSSPSHYIDHDIGGEHADMYDSLSHMSCPRSNGRLKKASTMKLRQWFKAHQDHPYPTEAEKQELMRKCGISRRQVNDWFVNVRKRVWTPTRTDWELRQTQSRVKNAHHKKRGNLHKQDIRVPAWLISFDSFEPLIAPRGAHSPEDDHHHSAPENASGQDIVSIEEDHGLPPGHMRMHSHGYDMMHAHTDQAQSSDHRQPNRTHSEHSAMDVCVSGDQRTHTGYAKSEPDAETPEIFHQRRHSHVYELGDDTGDSKEGILRRVQMLGEPSDGISNGYGSAKAIQRHGEMECLQSTGYLDRPPAHGPSVQAHLRAEHNTSQRSCHPSSQRPNEIGGTHGREGYSRHRHPQRDDIDRVVDEAFGEMDEEPRNSGDHIRHHDMPHHSYPRISHCLRATPNVAMHGMPHR